MHEPDELLRTAPAADPDRRWLSELREKVWDRELLVSGGLVVGLFSLPDAVHNGVGGLRLDYGVPYPFVLVWEVLILMGVNALTLVFVLHLLLRGLAVGFASLAVVFPAGVRPERLPLAGAFQREVVTMPPVRHRLSLLDRVASALFSFGFQIVFLLLGLLLLTVVLLALPYLLDTDNWIPNWVWLMEWGLILLFILDASLLGVLRRWRWTAWLYYPVYKVIGTVALAGFQRRLHYTFRSYIHPLLLWLIYAGFLGVTFLLSYPRWCQLTGTRPFYEKRQYLNVSSKGLADVRHPSFYDDTRPSGRPISGASLPAFRVSDGLLEVFLHYDQEADVVMDSLLARFYPSYRGLAVWQQPPGYSTALLAMTSRMYELRIDKDTTRCPAEWLGARHPSTEQPGSLALLNVSALPPGLHRLCITRLRTHGEDREAHPERFGWRTNWRVIPFYKLPPGS